MQTAVILGVNGQDGSYLAESLCRRGYFVVGIGRDPVSRHVRPHHCYRYEALDLATPEGLRNLVEAIKPDLAFHVAAVHGATGDGYTYESSFQEMMHVNLFALHVLLEHARISSPKMRIIYAGSSKIFPSPYAGVLDESSPKAATCLYSIGKMAARDLILQYRVLHGIYATNLILFNHDSARRPGQFFLPKMATVIAAAQLDNSFKMPVQTLDFRIDWSAADEVMEMVAGIAVDPAGIADLPEMIVASGNTLEARQFVTLLFQNYGLNVEEHIVEKLPRSDGGKDFTVNINSFVSRSGRKPVKTAFDIVSDILHSRDFTSATDMLGSHH